MCKMDKKPKYILLYILTNLLSLCHLCASQDFNFQTCCKFQKSFHLNQCNNHKHINFPISISWKLLTPNGSIEQIIPLLSNSSEFKCTCGESTKILISGFNVNKSIFQDGYLQVKNLIVPPNLFCVNSISVDNQSMEIVTCPEDSIPKCCPWGKVSRWLHPELCYDKLLRNQDGIFYKYAPLNCINLGKTTSTKSVDLSNKTAISLIQKELSKNAYCFDHVITSHDTSYNWSVHTGLFYCDEDWPYYEFQLKKYEKILYGNGLALSLIFLLISIGIYYIKLQRTHCHVHTWIEFFYMITVFILAVFCMLQAYFPEEQNNFCTLYHFICVVGYVVFAIAQVFWSTILSYELFYAFSDLRSPVHLNSEQDISRLYIYSCTGFLFPVFVTVLIFGYSYFSWGTDIGYCIPVQFSLMRIVQGVLLLMNLVCFIGTVRLIFKHRRVAKLARLREINSSKTSNQLIRCFLKLYLICGITYTGVIIGYLVGSGRSTAWYLISYRLFLSLRGVTIFFVYICNKKTKIFICQYFKGEMKSLCKCCQCSGSNRIMLGSIRTQEINTLST